MACNRRTPRKLPIKLEIPTKRSRGFVILCAALAVILCGTVVRRIVVVSNIPRYRDIATPEPVGMDARNAQGMREQWEVRDHAESRIAYYARRLKDLQKKPGWKEALKSTIVLDESKALWNRPGSEVLKEWLIGVGPPVCRPRLYLP